MGPRPGVGPGPAAPRAAMLSVTPPRTMIPETMAQSARNFVGTENLPRSSTFVENSRPLTLAVIAVPNSSLNARLISDPTRTRPLESTLEVNLAELGRCAKRDFAVKDLPTVKPFTFHPCHLILVITPKKYINLCGKGRASSC